jgi:hypothetical protein
MIRFSIINLKCNQYILYLFFAGGLESQNQQ